MTTLAFWCEFAGWQGGTIHQAFAAFDRLPLAEKDRFCGRLVDNIRTIEDPRTATRFMNARIGL